MFGREVYTPLQTVLPFILILQDTEVALVPRACNSASIEPFTDGTLRFVRVGAIVEMALLPQLKDLSEVVTHPFALKLYRAKSFDAWGVDEIGIGLSTIGDHLGEGSGVHPHIVCLGDILSAEISPRYKGIDKGGLPHSRVPAK